MFFLEQKHTFPRAETHFFGTRKPIAMPQKCQNSPPRSPVGHLEDTSRAKRPTPTDQKSRKTDPQKGTNFREQELVFSGNRTVLFARTETHFLEQKKCTFWTRRSALPGPEWIRIRPKPDPGMIQIRLKLDPILTKPGPQNGPNPAQIGPKWAQKSTTI